MSRPIAICLEDLRTGSPERRYLRCTALVGRAPGLRLDGEGAVRWRTEVGAACELWVSADDRLILYRAEGAGPVIVRRGLRSLEVPAAKPVVLLDQDEAEVGGRRLRVHVHGVAPRVHEPEFLRAPAARGASKVATALALGAALGAADCKKDNPAAQEPPEVEVREQPPSEEPTPPPPEDAGTPSGDASAAAGDTGPASADSLPAVAHGERGAAPDAVSLLDAAPEIEIRVAPPQMLAPMVEPGEAGQADADAVAAPTDAGEAGAENAGATEAEAGRPARDARPAQPPEIEVRDLPPYDDGK
ncbi:MAG: hypothetical protein HY907_17945 [Deltaproteobacteria bacterium]|nr:hypothetical protein [Deltaproteobacteria bacterium]